MQFERNDISVRDCRQEATRSFKRSFNDTIIALYKQLRHKKREILIVHIVMTELSGRGKLETSATSQLRMPPDPFRSKGKVG